MDFGLSDDQREIQRTARELLAERARPERVREHAEARRTDEDLWRELCELGWPGIAVAEQYGGQGLGQIELSILCEELGRSLAPVPFLPSVLAATVIQQDGSEAQRERWLPGLASGETIGAVAMGVEGVAELVIGGREAGVFVLIDELHNGRLISSEEADVSPIDTVDPTRSAARVSATAGAGEVLSPTEEFAADACIGLGRALVSVSSELVGVCDRALELTVAYVKERKQFGVPVGSFQAVSHRCAEMLLATERARSMAAYAAWAAHSDSGPSAAYAAWSGSSESEQLAEAATMAKATASDAAREVTASAIQAHGGIGFTWEADVHWLYKRAQIDAALLGGVLPHRMFLVELLERRAGLAQAESSPVG